MGIRIYREDGWKGQNGNKDLPQGCSGRGGMGIRIYQEDVTEAAKWE
jgi:hypothetical protein